MTLSRRSLLKRAGLCSAAKLLLPELHNPAYAAGHIPKLFLMFYSYHGTLKSEWGSGTNGLTLGPLLSPLEPFKNDVILVGGVNLKSAQLHRFDNYATHIAGQIHSLTSIAPRTPITSAASRPAAGGPSIDQAILHLLKEKNEGRQLTSVDSLQVGIANSAPGLDLMLGRAGYKMDGTPISYFNDPRIAYNSLFNGFVPGGSSPPTSESRIRRRRQLMASFAKGQFASSSETIRNLYGRLPDRIYG